MTEPTFDSYEAKAYEVAINMLAASTQFQALVGAASATAAKGRIIEYEGGDNNQVATAAAIATTGASFSPLLAHGLIRIDAFTTTDPATDYEARSSTTEIMVVIPDGTTADDLVPPWRYRRFLNIAGGIRQNLADAMRAVGNYGLGSVSLMPDPIPDETGYLRHHLIARITIDWRTP